MQEQTNQKTKTALISGISGQDGAYLSRLLLEKGYEVVGCARRNASGSLWRLDRLGIKNQVKIMTMELSEFSNIFSVIEKVRPDEIYNLGAMSFVADSFNVPAYTMEVDAMGFLHILESVRRLKLDTKIYQACTSEMFGKVREMPQTEKTPFYPRSPYGVAKLAAYWLGVNYRESYNMFVANGILFNHESPLRGSEFVTKKIVEHLVKYKLGLTKEPLQLGNIKSQRDWGFAGDYVEAMYLMLQQETPDDFVISTGETHTVKEFLEEVCSILDLTLDTNLININADFIRPAEVDILLGDSSKAQQLLDWKPKTTFKELVKIMVSADMEVYKNDIR